jgi:16S rRNA (cytosine967-C5)-methyltransferase
MAGKLAVWASGVDVGAMKPPAQPQKRHPPKSGGRPPFKGPRPAGGPPARPVAGLEARRAALALVEAALGRRGGMDEVDAPVLAGLESRDRGFARALALATLRWQGPLNRLLGERLRKAPPASVSRLLQLGAVQMLALETPAHAAVSTTLALAGQDREGKTLIKLINAVLRGIDRERPDVTPEQFAPDWLYARWRAAYGEATAMAIAARIAEEPPTDLSLRDPVGAEALATAVEGVVLPGGTVRTGRRGDIAAWPGFESGDWWVQDAAAAIPARLLAVQPGETALDLCAAPGGKTLQLAAAGARVVALDRSAERLGRVRANLARTKLEAEAIAADAAAWEDTRTFDAVLLDAPCSATGTFRRNPDVLWTCKPTDIAPLAAAQSRLLDAAATKVRLGGRLVYCVCSLEPEEGEGQISAFLDRHPELALEPVQPGEGGAAAEAIRPDGTVRLIPSQDPPAGGLDGFFAARFRRKG